MTPPLCSWVVGCPEAFKSKEASIHRFAGQGRARITGMRSFGNSFIPILFVSLKFVDSEEEMRVSHQVLAESQYLSEVTVPLLVLLCHSVDLSAPTFHKMSQS